MPRQKEFDPDQALGDAMELFWEQGYEATSVQELVDRMGINRFSMYDTFGSKHELFVRAINRYREVIGSTVLTELEDSDQGIESIRAYFSRIVDHLTSPKGKRACLVVNSLAEKAAHDGEIEECVMGDITRLEKSLKKAVERAQKLGEIGRERDPKELAEYLVTNVIGLNVLGKAKPGRDRLERNVETIIGALE